MMRCPISAALVAAFLASPAAANVIASCGPLSGHSYFPKDEFRSEGEWAEDGISDGVTIFIGSDAVEDVIIKSTLSDEPWTRSASDYGAPVVEVYREGAIRHVVVLWGPVTEVYKLDTENKVFSLVSQKGGGLLNSTLAMVGPCE